MTFAYGMDISSLLENENNGANYSYHGHHDDLITLLKQAQVNAIRLRLWHHPYNESNVPYGGGTNDLNATLTLAKRVVQAKMDLVLDFHYSDFWADPGKQYKPKAWEHLSEDGLVQALYEYTKSVLLRFEKERIPLKWIQIGNEITNGFCWPDGKLYENNLLRENGLAMMIRLIKAGIKACREVSPESDVILHLDRGGDKKLYHQWFAWMKENSVDYDVIGMSYYPYWHGTLADLGSNIAHCQTFFNKKVMIMETAYGFTGEKASNDAIQIPVIDHEKIDALPVGKKYPLTKEGQVAFMKDLFIVLHSQKVAGVFYWEPAWLPLKANTWATLEGRTYIHELHKGDGNEWANQGLFDYQGNSNPALDVYASMEIKE